MSQTLVIIGGGAAGFFCAVNAARMNPSLKVIILEKQDKVLQKVKVSGGGRCNVTHACFQLSELTKRYPRGQKMLKKTLSEFGPQDTIDWFKQRGVPLHTEPDGRMFPDTNRSQSIIDALLKEADQYQVQLSLKSDVRTIQMEGKKFVISCHNGNTYLADQLFVACGGFPKREQYHWLESLGHRIEMPVPSLFTFNIPKHPINELMGLSVNNAVVKINGTKLREEGPLLITHWGMSGPVILKLSAWGARELADRHYHFSISVNWIHRSESELREDWNGLRIAQGSGILGHKNPFGLPSRLWSYFLKEAGITEETRWSELQAKLQNRLIHVLTAQEFDVNGKTTFKEEFVTCGGISLQEVDAATMESKIVPGLYFGGEILDVDGITGGFNFQHAWASGYLAAKATAGINLNSSNSSL
ncbi:MAG: NAD(P)/FAD-dependent oxidoreductase [Chitinophagaceae bacterium]|nr:NAD(P)/FAD-dependent oxidoreductase [Chitinophagaceae bacterium]